MGTWISYGRISKRKKGDGAGAYMKIDAQHDANVAYVQGIAPDSQVLRLDDNLSAWDPDAVRPNWNRALDMLAAGEAQGIVGWHADRLTRQPLQGEQLLATCKRTGAQLHTTIGGHVASPLAFRIMGAVAAEESDQKSKRITMKHQLLADSGAYGGGPRRYGYEPRMTAVREAEAQWVRWMADGVLAGRSLNSMAIELAERGVTTAQGKQWRAGNIGTLLRSPHLAGLREHQGRIVGAATWTAILPNSTWEAVRLLLENPDRRTSKSQARRYLLSGVASCGSCGGVLRGRNNGTRATAPSYFCNACGVSRRADLVDARVVAEIVARLELVRPDGALDAPQAPAPDSRAALESEATQLAANLANLGAQAVLNNWAPETMQGAQEAASQRLAEIRSQLAELALDDTQPSAVLAGATGPAAAAVWASLDLDRQRAIVDLLATVTVHRAARKGAQFDPTLVQVEWK